MNPFTLLFSFHGRINRAKYWLAVFIYVIYLGVLVSIAYWYELEGGAFLVLALLAIPIWVSGLAVGIKRLHDRDKSGWWILLFYFGPQVLNGLASAAGSGKLVVDFSSIHPDAARSIAARLKTSNGMGWIDAPVSGGTPGAEQGTLAVMAGGDAADVERVRPYVLAMARRLTHMGPTGAGQTAKLCNQVIVGCAMAVLAEATRLAVNAGIDASRLPEALAGGFADSIPLQLFVPRMVQGIHSPPLGHIATMLKDLDTVIDVARDTSSPVPMSALAAQLFRLAKSARGADADALEIYKLSASRVG